jgi:hypothetical protein
MRNRTKAERGVAVILWRGNLERAREDIGPVTPPPSKDRINLDVELIDSAFERTIT